MWMHCTFEDQIRYWAALCHICQNWLRAQCSRTGAVPAQYDNHKKFMFQRGGGVLINVLLWGESTNHHWIPLTKGKFCDQRIPLQRDRIEKNVSILRHYIKFIFKCRTLGWRWWKWVKMVVKTAPVLSKRWHIERTNSKISNLFHWDEKLHSNTTSCSTLLPLWSMELMLWYWGAPIHSGVIFDKLGHLDWTA